MNVYSTRVVHVVQYVVCMYMCVVCTNKSVFIYLKLNLLYLVYMWKVHLFRFRCGHSKMNVMNSLGAHLQSTMYPGTLVKKSQSHFPSSNSISPHYKLQSIMKHF